MSGVWTLTRSLFWLPAQPAQAVRWSHWLLGHAAAWQRDDMRLRDLLPRVATLPLGSGTDGCTCPHQLSCSRLLCIHLVSGLEGGCVREFMGSLLIARTAVSHEQVLDWVPGAHHPVAVLTCQPLRRARCPWQRDSERRPLSSRPGVCRAGALAGNPFGVDRQFIARELGFVGGVCPNSMDAVSDRCPGDPSKPCVRICRVHAWLGSWLPAALLAQCAGSPLMRLHGGKL